MERNERIYSMLLRLVAARSDTNTPYERFIEDLLLSWLKALPYFRDNPDYSGGWPIKNDLHKREVIWAMRRGRGKRTIVMLHHHDTVNSEDYGPLKEFALRPDELKIKLAELQHNSRITKDLASEDWLFGRGSGDMKAGAVIQIALLEDYCSREDFQGNIVVISVPDEESLSKGMLAATELLQFLQENYSLDYQLAINSEPYFDQVKDSAIMYEGSVGKIMPVVFVKGIRSHISDPYSGINPSLILAAIQQRTEMNVDLCDSLKGEATPPPVWVNLKDRKKAYDASIPDAASGYFNWLTFTRSPAMIMELLKEISQQALDDVITRLQFSWQAYNTLQQEDSEPIEIEGTILEFHQLYQMGREKGGEEFERAYEAEQELIQQELSENLLVLPEGALRLMEFIVDYVDLKGPAVILGISGPYYPHVTNSLIPSGLRFNLHQRVNELSEQLYGKSYTSRAYFMGISDLSYASWIGDDRDIRIIKANSPGWDNLYKIPFAAFKGLQMPVVNIGPWAKDLHKATERVFLPDVLERVPTILDHLIQDILSLEE